jgi:hypothetical protein
MTIDVRERRLVANHDEAQTVRHIFERYLELGSVRLLKKDLAARAIVCRTKVPTRQVAAYQRRDEPVTGRVQPDIAARIGDADGRKILPSQPRLKRAPRYYLNASAAAAVNSTPLRSKNGNRRGAKPFSRGALYHLLSMEARLLKRTTESSSRI